MEGLILIPAHSPQAKGRIEAKFKFFQDRLIKEMRLRGIKEYEEANRFLREKFLQWHNSRYTLEAERVYLPLPEGKDLDLIFCIKKERRVRADNTIQFDGQIIQIPPSPLRLSFSRAKVEICLTEEGKIFVVYEGNVIAETVREEKGGKRMEEILERRENGKRNKKSTYVPSENHPWRRSFAQWKRLKRGEKGSKRETQEV